MIRGRGVDYDYILEDPVGPRQSGYPFPHSRSSLHHLPRLPHRLVPATELWTTSVQKRSTILGIKSEGTREAGSRQAELALYVLSRVQSRVPSCPGFGWDYLLEGADRELCSGYTGVDL